MNDLSGNGTDPLIPTDLRIALRPAGQTYQLTPHIPLSPDASHIFPLPRIPAAHVDEMAGTCRAAWRVRGLCLTYMLLIDLSSRQWSHAIPDQLCSSDAGLVRIRATLMVPAGYPLRVAGSFRCMPGPLDLDALTFVNIDGVHLSFHPDLGWTWLAAALCIEGQHIITPSESVIEEFPVTELDQQLRRVSRE